MKPSKSTKTPDSLPRPIREKIREMAHIIRSKRDELGLTQEELAEKAEISAITLQFIEQSRRVPSLPMLIEICKALGLSIKIG